MFLMAAVWTPMYQRMTVDETTLLRCGYRRKGRCESKRPGAWGIHDPGLLEAAYAAG